MKNLTKIIQIIQIVKIIKKQKIKLLIIKQVLVINNYQMILY